MAIIRERDYWQAKRLIPYWEQCIAKNKRALHHASNASEKDHFEYYIELYTEELEAAQQLVAQHEGEPVKRPGDIDRPSNESTLSQWVNA